jgi:membrane protein DedA with SNARE-associated domain
LAEQIIAHLGYVGIALILILGGLGLPIPEEAPIILAAVLSRNAKMIAPLAFATCLVGVLVGDFVVYFLGYFYGEKVLSLPVTRRLLTRAREAQIKGYFHRHGFKILILGRFAVGFRTAAYLTAGILKLPPLKLFLTDLVAALLSTSLMFGLGYVFANQIQSGIKEAQQWFTVGLGVSIALWLSFRYYKGRMRAGLPVGPPVLYGDEPPLPPDDLKSLPDEADAEVDSLVERRPPSIPSTVPSRSRTAVSAPLPAPPIPQPAAPPTTAAIAPQERVVYHKSRGPLGDGESEAREPAPRPSRATPGSHPRGEPVAVSKRDSAERHDDGKPD